MTKDFKPFGIAGGTWNNVLEAAQATYSIGNGLESVVPTPFIHSINPFNTTFQKARYILDIGCGVGRNAPYIIQETTATYVGIDPNLDMLKWFYHFNNPDHKNRMVTYESFEKMRKDGFGSEIWIDAVICTFVFQHLGYRSTENVMNVTDITKEVFSISTKNAPWFMYEHDGEESWMDHWMNDCHIKPEVYIRNYADIPELTHRGHHHLLIFQTPNTWN